ncbi:MAG: hypothetical protein ACO1NX_04200, partial [Chitinophagaceae bacterium]
MTLCTFAFSATAQNKKGQAVDSFAYYDDLFNELELFIDSITAPRSFATINVGAGNGFFNYQSASASLNNTRKIIITPSAGYYHKNGLGISLTGNGVFEQKDFNLYQVAASASYDYLQNRNFMTGVAYTHFFTKDSLQFYTSPLSNEAFAYFTYRQGWMKPSVAIGYGWGSRTNVEEREEKIKLLRGKPLNSTTIIETTESISDLSVAASVKRDFYWLNVLFDKDHFRFSPQLTLLSGTQKFGLNQTSNYNFFNKKSGTSLFQNTEQVNLADESKFRPLSLSAQLRGEFSKGNFFVQPQLIFDYYFPAEQHNISTAFAINT